MRILLVAALLTVVLLLQQCHGSSKKVRVLIAGSGINGASTAYFLRNISAALGVDGIPEEDLVITIAERSSRIGGRIRTLSSSEIGGKGGSGMEEPPVELGASVFHDVNQYMASFVKQFQLETSHPYISAKLGVFDGPAGLVFAETDISSQCKRIRGKTESDESWIIRAACAWLPREVLELFDQLATAVAAISRYWLDPLNAQGCVEVLVQRLLEIYRIQQGPRGEAFSTATQLARRLGLLDAATDVTLDEFLTTGNVRRESAGDAVCKGTATRAFVEELAHSFTMINYGQVPHAITALAGAVAMKGKGSEVHSIAGGNELLVQKLLENAKVSRVLTGVEVLWAGAGAEFAVSGPNADRLPQPLSQHFDAVVIAYPTAGAAHGSRSSAERPVGMHSTYVSIVRGSLNATALFPASATNTGGEGKLPTPPTIVTVTARGKQYLGGIRSVGRLQGVVERYKVFSDAPLTTAHLEEVLFLKGAEVVSEHVWEGAYPLYTVGTKQEGEMRASSLATSFVLHEEASDDEGKETPSVYYAGALESLVSTMETQCIGARNTALLVVQRHVAQKRHSQRRSTGRVPPSTHQGANEREEL